MCLAKIELHYLKTVHNYKLKKRAVILIQSLMRKQLALKLRKKMYFENKVKLL